MKILNTTNFNDFSLIESNRPPNWSRVANLRKEVKRKNLTKVYQVVVNSKAASKRRYGLDGTKMAIVDGQHRFLSCKLEGIKMYYQIADSVTLNDIPRAAAMQQSWKLTDYIHHYATNGKQQYMLLRSYMERNNFSPCTTVTILCGDRSTHVTDSLKNGELKISRNWTVSNRFAEAINELAKFIPFNKQARFVEAYLMCFLNKEFSHTKMITKLEYLSSRINKMSDTYSHLEQLENLYNFNSTDKVKLNTIERSSI